MESVLVKNADRMMTSVSPSTRGVELAFADRCKGLVPFKAIPEIGRRAALAGIDLPNRYEIILHDTRGDSMTLLGWFLDPRWRSDRERWVAEAQAQIEQRPTALGDRSPAPAGGAAGERRFCERQNAPLSSVPGADRC